MPAKIKTNEIPAKKNAEFMPDRNKFRVSAIYIGLLRFYAIVHAVPFQTKVTSSAKSTDVL